MLLSPVSGAGGCVQEEVKEERGGAGPEVGAGPGQSLLLAGAYSCLGQDMGRGLGGAGLDPILSRVVVAAPAVAVDPRQLVQAMPAARVEYIAPWWVVWLHNVPHFGLRLQRVDSTFSPGDETYQEVSRRSQPLRRTLRVGARASPRSPRSHSFLSFLGSPRSPRFSDPFGPQLCPLGSPGSLGRDARPSWKPRGS